MEKPDMLSMDKPDRPAKPKAEKPIPKGMKVATVSGLIAGLPLSLASAREAFDNIERRCSRATAYTGILTPAQTKSLSGIAEQIRAWLPELSRIRKDVDGMVAERIPKVEDLF